MRTFNVDEGTVRIVQPLYATLLFRSRGKWESDFFRQWLTPWDE